MGLQTFVKRGRLLQLVKGWGLQPLSRGRLGAAQPMSRKGPAPTREGWCKGLGFRERARVSSKGLLEGVHRILAAFQKWIYRVLVGLGACIMTLQDQLSRAFMGCGSRLLTPKRVWFRTDKDLQRFAEGLRFRTHGCGISCRRPIP